MRRKAEDKQKKADEKAKKAGSSRSVTHNYSKKQPPANYDEALPVSKQAPVLLQPLLVEGNNNQDLEPQSSTVQQLMMAP